MRAPKNNATLSGTNAYLLQQALQCHQSGNLQQAADLYQQILASDPENADANNLLGVIAHQAGNNQQAVQLITRAVNANPKLISAYNNLGVALAEIGRQEEAVENYRAALSLKQNYPEAHNNCGNALCDLGRPDDAAACYRKAIALKPSYAEAHNNLGNVLRAMGEQENAVASYRRAIKINPNFYAAYSGLGMAYANLRQWDEAVVCFHKVAQDDPKNAEAQNNLGNALKAKGLIEEAIECYKKAVTSNPSYAEAHKNLGVAFEHSGRLGEAVERYRKAIDVRPGYGEAYRHLSSAIRHSVYDDEIQSMEQLYADAAIQEEQRMHLCFALGKAYEDLEEYDKSFDFIAEANRIKRATYNYSTSQTEELFKHIKNRFSTDFVSDCQDMGVDDATPIFILGMPRSGTTLVEQIVASHPRVFGAGELGYMGEMANALCPQGEVFPTLPLDLDATSLHRFGADYVKKMREHSAEATYITDKMPHNFLYIGLIRIALPKAKIIHCIRSPIDTCLSIYKNYFADAHRYAYDLKELGEYYTLYVDLMRHWQQIFPGFIYDVCYEELIADQEGQTRSLLEYCGLPWDEACLSFYRAERSVQTASSCQVRQPIYSRSVRLSERYGDRLAVLKDMLN